MIESMMFLYHGTGFGINKSFIMAFVITTMLICGELHRLARCWPRISKYWFDQDLIIRSKLSHQPKNNCKRYFLQFTILTFLGQFGLSSVYIWWSYEDTLDNMKFCQYPENFSVWEYLHRRERPHIFSYIPFKIWMAPISQLQFFITDLGWIFLQNIVIFASVWITTRFQQLYDQIQEVGTTGTYLVWTEIHDLFNKLIDLVRTVDRDLANAVILTCSTRLVLICYDLFKSTRYV